MVCLLIFSADMRLDQVLNLGFIDKALEFRSWFMNK
jgi:hypothetical protein